MFLLNDSLEERVCLSGTELELDMSFDNILTAMDLVADEELSNTDKIDTFIYLLTTLNLDEIGKYDYHSKYDFMLSVIELFSEETEQTKEYDLQGNVMPSFKEKQPYSLVQDAEYIYSSFMQAYGMDLIDMQGKLHWRKFKALLNGLPQETLFKQIIDIRTQDLPSGKGSEDERKRIKKLKSIYELKGQELEEGD